jgi:hypothetical protein
VKYLIFIWFFALCFLESSAQVIQRQTTSAAGSTAQISYGNANLLIQSSIGQASVIGIAQTDRAQLRQGFIQPLGARSVRRSSENNLEVDIYPNPFREWFNVQFQQELNAEITITDLMGRSIFHTRIEGLQSAQIGLDQGAAGTYLVFIQSGNKVFK